MSEEAEIEHLRNDVTKKFGHTIESPSDYAQLQLQIERSTGETISESTLKRIFGYTTTTSSPRRSTLSVLARYLGYSGWSDYTAAICSTECGGTAQTDADTEQSDSGQTEQAEEAALAALLSSKHRNLYINVITAIVCISATVLAMWLLNPGDKSGSTLTDNELSERIAQQYDKQMLNQYTLALEAFESCHAEMDTAIARWNIKRNAFVKDFRVETLENLPRSEYDMCNTKGFAYRIKNEMGDFAVIDSKPYECQDYTDEQYREHMQNIVRLLKDGAVANKKGLNDNPLYAPLKHYLLMLYYPKSSYMPIWMDEQVDHFLDVFLPDKDIRQLLTPDGYIDKREILLRWKEKHPVMKQWDNITFGNFLFHFFPRDKDSYHKNNGIVDKLYEYPPHYTSSKDV